MANQAVMNQGGAIGSWVNPNTHQSKTVLTLSNGNRIVLVPSRFSATTLYVNEVSASGSSIDLRQTLTTPVSYREVVGATFVNNDIAIAVMSNDGKTVRYCKVIYGTWSAVTWETVFTAYASDKIRTFDISVSDTGAVALVHHWCNTYDMTSALHVRRPAGGAWINSWNDTLNTATGTVNRWVAGGDSCSVLWLDEESAGVRHIIIADAHAKANGDQGVIVKTTQITESTGAKVMLADVDVDVIATGEGSTSTSGTLKGRLVNLYRVSTSRFVVMAMHSAVNKKVVARMYQRGGSWAYGTVHSAVMTTTPVLMATSMRFPTSGDDMGGYGEYVFTYSTGSGTTDRKIHNLVCKLITNSVTGNNETWSSQKVWGVPSQINIARLASLGSRNLELSQVDVNVESYSVGVSTYNAYSQLMFAKIPTNFTGGNPLIQVQPLDGSTVPTASPTFWGKFEIAANSQQSSYRVHWQVAKDAAFTVSFSEYLSNLVDLPSTMPHSVGVAPVVLTGNPWYIRGRAMDMFGNAGSWTATNEFVQGHPPVAVAPFAPSGYAIFGTGSVYIDWEFSDTFSGDSQTAYQVRIYDAGTAALIHDTGKVTSTETRYLHAFTAPQKEVPMYFEVKLWDTEDNSLNWSDAVYFTLSDAPVVTLDTPVAGSTIATGVPTFAGEIDVAAGRTLIKEYTVTVRQAGVTVWSKRNAGSFSDPGAGYAYSEKIPTGYLQDGESYSAQVTTIDFAGLSGSSPVVTFTVDWIPPDPASGVAVDVSQYNIPDAGYVSVTWDDLDREVDNFLSWNVYRRSDLRDPETGIVLEVGVPVLVYTEYAISDTYEYRDFYAPSGYLTSYWVTQTVDRDGQEINSGLVGPGVSDLPLSEGYWLISPSVDQGDASAFKLSQVTGDSFTEEEEEAEIIVIGIGRTYQKGERLGAKGTLDCQLRNTDGTTARQKRLRLDMAQQQDAELWLRNPFGDLFKVNVSQISLTRIAGVGIAEFCDVTIPYAKVGR